MNKIKIDQSICPLCQQDNGCKANTGKKCWCATVVIPKSLLDLVPGAQRGQACICRTCIDKYETD